jgi:hypothetical protein
MQSVLSVLLQFPVLLHPVLLPVHVPEFLASLVPSEKLFVRLPATKEESCALSIFTRPEASTESDKGSMSNFAIASYSTKMLSMERPERSSTDGSDVAGHPKIERSNVRNPSNHAWSAGVFNFNVPSLHIFPISFRESVSRTVHFPILPSGRIKIEFGLAA